MRTFVFKAYASKRNRKLHKQIDIAASIWNHCIALHKRYYRRYGKHLNVFTLKKHITKLKRLPRYSFWKELGSQAVQDVVLRVEKSYQLFFGYLRTKKAGTTKGRKVRPPSFKKRSKYTSFTLTQAGYAISGNSLRIGKQQYRFFKSREMEGNIKTLTVKRDALGDIYFVFVTDAEHQTIHAATTEIAGMDFGLKDFLTISDGTKIAAPLPLKKQLKALKKASRSLSRKQKGSNHWRRARKALARVHRSVANQRKDFHFKLAKHLTHSYNALAIEDLNLSGMKALWGRKVSDLGFASFVHILDHQATKTGCSIVKIDRWYPSSKTCSVCGWINEALSLHDRFWTCECDTTHDRDINAAINIQRVGASALGLGDVRPVAIPAIAV
ncbi:MAG: transposase [Desulfuromonas sp.]|jgi:putative transposase|nr:transposase [Desulfuromonas sp.]